MSLGEAVERDETFIINGTVITGDGSSMYRGATVHIVGDLITAVDPTGAKPGAARIEAGARVIDAERGFVIPGVVNAHAHGCSTGPLFSSAAKPLNAVHALRNAERHLEAGVTTLVNVCGFGVAADLDALKEHPLRIFLGTTHFPEAIAAAQIVDGEGIMERTLEMSAERMLSEGAAAIGEVGSGATLGGGVCAYKYVPAAVQELFGTEINPAQATQIIDALLGPLRQLQDDETNFYETLRRFSITDGSSGSETRAARLRDTVLRYAYQPVLQSLALFPIAGGLSAHTGVPAVYHTAAPSADMLLQVAQNLEGRGAKLVAGHLNHTSMTCEEAVAWAREYKDLGVYIDVSVLDIVSTLALAKPDVADALVSTGLVDTFSTDYAGGHWDSMLEAVQRWWRSGALSLPQGVAMATKAPADLFSVAAHNRGELAAGRAADIVICEEVNVSRIHMVMIDGKIVRDIDPLIPHSPYC